MGAFLLNAALSMAVFLTALLVAELLIRHFAPQPLIVVRPDVWRPADTLGWEARPGIRTTINSGEGLVELRTDREGYRIGAEGRREAETELLLLGDSFVIGLQVPYEQSFAGLLEARLPGWIERPVAVRALGANDRDPNHYRIAAQRALGAGRFAALVTFLFVGNDVVTTRVAAFPPRQPAERARVHVPRNLTPRELLLAAAPINDVLETRSQLYIFVRARLDGVRRRLERTSRELPLAFRRGFADAPAWDVTAGICREIADIADRSSARALFVLIPTHYQPDTALWSLTIRDSRVDPAAFDREQPSRRLREALSARELEVVDLLPTFTARARRGEDLYGRVDPHLSVAGHEAVAESILPRVAALLESAGRTGRGGRATPPAVTGAR